MRKKKMEIKLEHSQLYKNHKFKDLTFYIDSEDLVGNVNYIEKNNLESVGLNPFKGFNSNHLQDLLPIKDRIRRLDIECRNMDLHNLSEFTNLEYLYIIDGNKDFDLGGLDKLKSLNFTYDKSVLGFENLKSLSELVVNKSTKQFTSIIEQYIELKSLKIRNSKLDNGAQFLSKLINLEFIEFYNYKSNIDLNNIIGFKSKLKVLKFEKCNKIEGIDYLTKFESLEELHFVDSILIPDTSFIKKLKKLKALVVLGKSYFIDGNLSILLSHASLTHVGIDNKKHYSHKYEDFKNT